MDSGMSFELNKLHIADLHREADQARLARLIPKAQRTSSIDAVGFRARIARRLGTFRPIGAGGQNPANS